MGRFTFGTSKFAQATGSRHVTECVGEAFELFVLPSSFSAGLIIMNRTLHPILIVIVLMFLSVSAAAQERSITRADLIEKISGFWIGQLVGNYMGFPFENVYVDEPIPVLVDRYYTPFNGGGLRMNRNDHRAFAPYLFTACSTAPTRTTTPTSSSSRCTPSRSTDWTSTTGRSPRPGSATSTGGSGSPTARLGI
jgi:hypothetical protein